MLTDPADGDFRPLPESPAIGYGCQTFLREAGTTALPALPPSPAQSTSRPLPIAPPDDACPGTRNLTVSGPITEDTLWDADTVTVVGDLFVEDGVTLSISPGLLVRVDGYFAINIAGRLLALGEPTLPIVFTSSQPDLFAIDSTTTTGAWRGLRFDNTPASNSPSKLAYARISHCKNATSGGRGGAIYISNYDGLELVNCILNHNVAANGAALFCSHFAAPRITDCLITDNYAFIGGAAVFNLNAYPKLANNTIVANFVLNPDIFHETNAIHNFIAKPQLTNNIIRDNGCSYFIGGEILEGKAYYITYNNITDGFAGVGNIDLPPLFSGGGEFPYGLSEFSPCLDAGRPDSTGLSLPEWDLAGNNRLQNDRVDIGAFEWQPISAVDTETLYPILERGSGEITIVPNPGRTFDTISFRLNLNQSGVTQLVIHDINGREVTRLIDGFAGAGSFEVTWNGSNQRGQTMPAGVYYYRLHQSDRFARSGKVIRIR